MDAARAQRVEHQLPQPRHAVIVSTANEPLSCVPMTSQTADRPSVPLSAADRAR
jgi:hypothetical protein